MNNINTTSNNTSIQARKAALEARIERNKKTIADSKLAQVEIRREIKQTEDMIARIHRANEADRYFSNKKNERVNARIQG